LYGLIVVLVWMYARSARWLVTPLLLIPVLVAVARMYEGAHHLSDVLASLVYASLWLAATALAIRPRAAGSEGR
jgi:undecaprenyl-diphosphatase